MTSRHQRSHSEDELRFIGSESPSGTYVLRIRVRQMIKIAFGRFKKGKLIEVVAGDYLYVGSALSERGATCLARRLVRHASRTGDKPPHRLREQMLIEFPKFGLSSGNLLVRSGKNLHWNVDHLLDELCVDLVQVYAIRSPLRLESEVARLLTEDPGTVVFERGLGANDICGGTQLLRVDAGEDWWQAITAKLLFVLTRAECRP